MFRNIFSSRRMVWLWSVWLLILVFMSLMRVIFYFRFSHGSGVQGSVWPAWWMGLRFDLRIASMLVLPVMIVTAINYCNPFRRKAAKIFWLSYFGLAGAIMLIFYIADMQYYDYRHARLDAELLGLMEDAGISMRMVWQTYPVIRILLVLAAAIFLWVWLNRKMMKWVERLVAKPVKRAIVPEKTDKDDLLAQPGQDSNPSKLNTIAAFTVTFFAFTFFCWGKIDMFPLRWSDAASLQNDFKTQMALNPFESFLNSLRFRNEKPDLDKVKQYYPVLSSAYQLPATDTAPSFLRVIPATGDKKPNIVLVLCESYSFYKSSMSGNPLNPTPYFDSLRKEGIFFSRCFTPAYGTARGVWATLTGTPDVTFIKTASRNPRAVDQHSIMNDFTGYSKQYFIGGSASWANIRGLILNNINGIKLYEEPDYRSPGRDVWGISDKDLFMEATDFMTQTPQPFFSMIQTANNHRPYTIPAEDKLEMGMMTQPLDSLLKYGYNVNSSASSTNEEYNAMRYMDFCIRKFMEKAAKQPWFNNTIFLFIGDHGIRGNAGPLMPQAYTDKGLTCEHVPLLIWSPLLQKAEYPFVCSQVDVLPTLAGLAGVQYTNTTLGRDLLQVAKDSTAQKFAFIIDHDTKNYGVIWDDFYYSREIRGKKESFTPILPGLPEAPPAGKQEHYRQMATGLYETSRYLLYNNKKQVKAP